VKEEPRNSLFAVDQLLALADVWTAAFGGVQSQREIAGTGWWYLEAAMDVCWWGKRVVKRCTGSVEGAPSW
jgi:hypothetical protein